MENMMAAPSRSICAYSCFRLQKVTLMQTQWAVHHRFPACGRGLPQAQMVRHHIPAPMAASDCSVLRPVKTLTIHWTLGTLCLGCVSISMLLLFVKVHAALSGKTCRNMSTSQGMPSAPTLLKASVHCGLRTFSSVGCQSYVLGRQRIPA